MAIIPLVLALLSSTVIVITTSVVPAALSVSVDAAFVLVITRILATLLSIALSVV